MRDEDRVRISHMIEAAEDAIEFVSGCERSEFDTNRMRRFAVVRAVEILGEAASKVSAEVKAANSAIPWKAIAGMRNRLVHAYSTLTCNWSGNRPPSKSRRSCRSCNYSQSTHNSRWPSPTMNASARRWNF